MSQGESTLNGYEFVNCISTGSVSQVWEVKQQENGQSFAMKLLLPEALKEGGHKATMRHEAAVAKQLEHPNIVRFVEAKFSRKFGYIVMELFRSINLKSLIRGDLDATHVRLRRIMEASTQAFAYMHEKNWLHKDIKPENILVTKGGELRVIDFSLAGRPSSAVGRMMSRKKNIAIQGTRSYISPEHVKRDKITKASDIYSLGVVFYEALTGRPPFMGRTPNELLMAHVRDHPDVPSSYHPNVTAEADALVMRMLAKKPKDRPESMQQVFSEVRSIKLFKQDPEVYQKERLAREEEERFVGIDQRLDSREDAARTAAFGYQPAKPAPQKPVPIVESSPKQPVAQAPQQPPAPAQPPAMAPGYHPGMQQMPMPAMMQHYPAPPPMMGGAFAPGYFGVPQPGMQPPASYPGMPPFPPQQPVPQPPQHQPPQHQPPPQPAQHHGAPQQQSPPQPATPQPATPQPATPQTPPPAAQPAPQPQQPRTVDEERNLEVPDNLDWLSVS